MASGMGGTELVEPARGDALEIGMPLDVDPARPPTDRLADPERVQPELVNPQRPLHSAPALRGRNPGRVVVRAQLGVCGLSIVGQTRRRSPSGLSTVGQTRRLSPRE